MPWRCLCFFNRWSPAWRRTRTGRIASPRCRGPAPIQEHAGVVGLFVDAINEQAARFYAHFGFEAFADDALKLFFSVR